MTISADATATPTGTPEPPRDRWGRYIFPGPDGKARPHRRVTTVAKKLDDTYNLERWKMRMVAAGIGLRQDLYSLASSHDVETDRPVFDDVAEKAMEAAGSSAKAALGTALHRFTERLDAKEITIDQVPTEWRERCAVYLARMAEMGVQTSPDLCEIRIIDDNYTVAGTADRVVTCGDGITRISDLKTGGNLDYGWLAFSIQMAAYANHTATAVYSRRKDTWERGPRIEVDRSTALIVHLPSTGPVRCDIYTVDIEQGYAAYMLAHEIMEWQKTKGLSAVYRPTGPTPTLEVWVRDRLAAVKANPAATESLKAAWPLRDAAGRVQRYDDNPTPDQTEALITALDLIEARYQIPFGPPRPGPRPTNPQAN